MYLPTKKVLRKPQHQHRNAICSPTLSRIINGPLFHLTNDDHVDVIVAVFILTLANIVATTCVRKIDGRLGRSILPRQLFDFTKDVSSIGLAKFRRRYRMGLDTFLALYALIRNRLDPEVEKQAGLGNTADGKTKLLITLRLLAGAKYLDVSWPYGVADSTVYSIFDETLTAIEMELRGNIQFPKTEADCRMEAQKFQFMRRSPIHGIISALDGIAIAIQAPKLDEVPDPRKYFNRKHFYSLSIQAAVGADYRFQFSSACHAGSTHDATAYRARSYIIG